MRRACRRAFLELRTPAVNLGVRGTEFRSRVEGARTVAEVTQGRVAGWIAGARCRLRHRRHRRRRGAPRRAACA
ncbi:MAG: FecR domain-containing protein [Rubrivivax sp.]